MGFISINSNLAPQRKQIILGFTPFSPEEQLLTEESSPGPDLGVFQKHGIANTPELQGSEMRFPSCVCYLVGSCTLEPLLSLLVFLPSARRISGGERSSSMRALGERVLHGQRSRPRPQTGIYRSARGCATSGAFFAWTRPNGSD